MNIQEVVWESSKKKSKFDDSLVVSSYIMLMYFPEILGYSQFWYSPENLTLKYIQQNLDPTVNVYDYGELPVSEVIKENDRNLASQSKGPFEKNKY